MAPKQNFVYWEEEHSTTRRHFHIIDPSGFQDQKALYAAIRKACGGIRNLRIRDNKRSSSFDVFGKSGKKLLHVSCQPRKDAKTKDWKHKIHIFADDAELLAALMKELGARKTDSTEGYMFDYM